MRIATLPGAFPRGISEPLPEWLLVLLALVLTFARSLSLVPLGTLYDFNIIGGVVDPVPFLCYFFRVVLR